MQPPSPHSPDTWDAASADYDANFTQFTALYADKALELAQLSPESRVLEVASGGGALTMKLAPRCQEVLAVDYSASMVKLLRGKLASAGVSNVKVERMDGTKLEISSGAHERGICQFGMMLFDDPARGMAEMCRVLTPGGRAVISGWAGPERFESFAVLGAALRRALPDMPPPPPSPTFSLADPDTFVAMLGGAGFDEARVEHLTQCLESPSPEAFVESMSGAAPPARALFTRVGPEASARIRDAMIAILRERFGDGPVSLSNTATIGVASKRS